MAPEQANERVRRYGTMSIFDNILNRFGGYRRVDDVETEHGGPAIIESREEAMFEISRMKGISLFEKKCLLVNREMDAMGMGRYQWYLWALCGMGYFMDLLWAHMGGAILQPIVQEFGFTGAQIGSVGMANGIGMSIGAAFWGTAVDVIGRWWSFNLTCLMPAVFGVLQGTSRNFSTYMLMGGLCGFGIGGNIPIDTTIILEFLPQNKRWLLPCLSIFQSIGVTVAVAIAYVFIPNHSCSPNFTEPNPLPSCYLVSAGTPCCGYENNKGWRYTMYVAGIVSAGVFLVRVVLFRMQESPKFLIYKGHDERAIQSLKNVCKINGRPCGITLGMLETLAREHDEASEGRIGGAMEVMDGKKQANASFRAKVDAELTRIKVLFANRNASRLFILTALIYMCDYYGFTIAGIIYAQSLNGYSPTLIALKGGALKVSLKDTYRSYFYAFIPGGLGVLFAVLSYEIPHFGRKGGMLLSSGVMGGAIMAFSKVNTRASNVWLNAVVSIACGMFNSILYGWTPEAFPAPVRGTATGLCSFGGRVAGVLAPFTAALVLPTRPGTADYEKVMFLGGGVTLGCVLWLLLLPSKLMGAESL